jgi:anti-anti-sigma factor
VNNDLNMTPHEENTLSIRSQNGYSVATISGEFGIARVPELRELLLSLLGARTSRIIIDLSRVTRCDASGLAVLVGVGRRAGLLGGVLRLAAATPPVAAVLHLTGLDVHFVIFATVSAAAAPAHLGIPDASLQRRVPMSQLSTRPLARVS